MLTIFWREVMLTAAGFLAGVLFMMFVTAKAVEERYRWRVLMQAGKMGLVRIIVKTCSGDHIRRNVRFGDGK